MKVIIINGSPRNQGITATTLHVLEKELLDSGVKVDFVSLAEIEMVHCLGCCSCYRTGHCCIRDDAAMSGPVAGATSQTVSHLNLSKTHKVNLHTTIQQLLF